MKIQIKYIENREEVRFQKFDNLLLSEEAIDKIRRI